ncbi:MAG: efflux RND transporter permease subunit, partial [Bifidobacteriaceae bacterium]|nr:efflux RND transporter permease subunit [Bifidobacteriaceae bacterium]
MFRLTELSLRNRAVVALVSIAIVVGGLSSMTSLKQEMMPPMNLPMALVMATNSGVSSNLMDEQLTGPIESAIGAVPGVESISTTSMNGVTFSIVEFRYAIDIDAANQKLSTAISRLQRALPDGVETSVVTGSMDDLPIVDLAVRSSDLAALDHVVNDVLEPRLSRIENVRGVEITGFTPDQVVISPSLDDLAANGVSLEQIHTALTNNGFITDAGQVSQADQTLAVQSGQHVATTADLEALPLALGAEGTVTLGDVAEIVQGPEPSTTYSRLGGETAVAVSITKTPDGNTVDVSHLIKDAVASLQATFDEYGVEAAVVFDQAPYVEDSIAGLMEEGLIGLSFAVLVILVFLVSVRATLVSAVSI